MKSLYGIVGSAKGFSGESSIFKMLDDFSGELEATSIILIWSLFAIPKSAVAKSVTGVPSLVGLECSLKYGLSVVLAYL